jgi:MFS transporter, NNP family, nitrate/nitrite transporter
VTGVVGATGGLGGFFPPAVMGIVRSAPGGYAIGFVPMALVARACLIVLGSLRSRRRAGTRATVPSAGG